MAGPFIVVARAFGGAKQLFHIGRIDDRIVFTDAGGTTLPTAATLALVDKLAYVHDDGKLALVVPVLPGTLALEWETVAKKLRVKSKIRCFSFGDDDQVIALRCSLILDGQKRPQFAPFEVDDWEPKGGQNRRFDQLAGLTFTFDAEAEFPLFARFIGIERMVDQPKNVLSLTLAKQTIGPPAFEFACKEHHVAASKQTIAPFGIPFDGDDLPKLHNQHAMQIVVRQPHVSDPDDPNDPLAWPANHWIATVQVPAQAAIAHWNDAFVAPYVAALHTVQDGRPVSLLPSIEITDGAKAPWTVKLSLFDLFGEEEIKDNDSFTIRQAKSPAVAGKVTIFPRGVEPPGPVNAAFTLPAFIGLAGEARNTAPLRIGVRLDAVKNDPIDAENDLATHNEGYLFSILHQSSGLVAPNPSPFDQRVRVGALDLLFAGSKTIPFTGIDDLQNKLGVLAGSFRRGEQGKLGEQPGLPRLEQLRLVLGNTGVRPGGQDEIPGEEFNESSLAFAEPAYDALFRRDRPVLIDLTSAGVPSSLVVDVHESSIEHESQTITMQLRKPTESSTPVNVIVLDPHPFLVGKVEVPALEGDLGGETNEIANWSNRAESSAWEIAGAASGFDLVLPPQGVGESMAKRTGDFIGTDGKAQPADFRFSPNARMRLRSSFFRQRFVEAPWNLRRVLGYPGQRAPGAGVETLAFELLYGLSVRVENDDLRMAEIAARLGHLPGRQEPLLPWRANKDQKNVYKLYRNAWGERYRALLSRLAILEPYDERRDTLALTDVEGVSYELRKEAHLRDPIPNRDDPRFEKDGLAGGWSWGFESANILDAVLRGPKSSSGLVARPFFSALGGWGFQKASFDRNLSTIYSDTSMGRTFSISIERIGRISVFWNRAKHVIVYERTVMPTRQFAAEQDPVLVGVPVLRKVREYVEILQDERGYPEFGEAEITRGFVRACSFPEGSRRINVTSAWGEDIGRIGWKVPLWKRGQDAIVYPRPSIALNVAGDHPDKIVPLTIADPEKLYFFTNTQAEMPPNSDLWPAVEGVDYPPLPMLKPETPQFGSGKVANKSDPPPTVVAGTGGFTFAVDPSPHAVNVVDVRTEDPIGAVLHNVTMIRGPLEQTLASLSLPVARDVVDAAMAKAKALVPKDVTNLPQLVADVATALTNAQQNVQNLTADLLNQQDRLCPLVRERVQQEVDRALDETGIRRSIDELLAAVHGLGAAADAELAIFSKDLTIVLETHRANLDAIRKRVHDEAIDAVRSVKAAAGEIPRALRDARTALVDAQTTLAKALDDISSTTASEVEWTENLLDQFKAAVAVRKDQIDALIAKIERAIDAAGRAATGPLPNKAALAVRKFSDATHAIADRLTAIANLAKEKIPTPDVVRQNIADAKSQINAAFVEINSALTTIETSVNTAIANTTLEKRIDALDDEMKAAIDNAITQGKQYPALIDDIRKRLAEKEKDLDSVVRTHVDELRTLAAAKAEALCKLTLDAMKPFIESLDPYVKDAAARLQSIFDGAQPIGEDVLAALERIRAEADRRLADLGRLLEQGIRTSAERSLRLLRSFGDVPRVPGLGFDRPQIGYLFVDLERLLQKLTPELPAVSLSPILARANELLDSLQLSPIRIELPSVQLLERVIPFSLDQFDLNSIFPDFAGLRLDGLFSNLRMPKVSNEYVRVTHGFDQQAMRGWVEVQADVPYDEPTTILSIAGITLRLLRARFHATSRIEAGVGQSPTQTFRGDIVGDWELAIGGFGLVTLVETRLRFDDHGNIRFEVSPDRIKLQAVLSFISTLMEKFGYSDSGFSILALPSGIRSTLDLPLPDIQGGSFGLANLRLGCIFELNFADPEADGKFAIRTRFFVGSPRAPFTLTVFILGGAGWVDVQLLYVPSPPTKFLSKVSIGIMAAASLAISLGPIRGGIYAYFGITVDYVSGTGGVSNLTIGLLLLFRGEVCLLGFLSVGLCLALEAQYTPSGGLVGRGHVSYSIKICWCVTINVSTSVSYTFGSSGGGTFEETPTQLLEDAVAFVAPTHADAARDYVNMFFEVTA